MAKPSARIPAVTAALPQEVNRLLTNSGEPSAALVTLTLLIKHKAAQRDAEYAGDGKASENDAYGFGRCAGRNGSGGRGECDGPKYRMQKG